MTPNKLAVKQAEHIKLIQDFVDVHGVLPTSSTHKTTPTFPRREAFRSTFGTFTNAIIAAGFAPTDRTPRVEMYVCDMCSNTYSLTGTKLYQHTIYTNQVSGNIRHFCSQSCSTKYHNTNRGRRSEATRSKIRAGVLASARATANRAQKLADGQLKFSKIRTCSCAHCGMSFVNRTRVKYCKEHQDLYKSSNRNKYAFTFSIRDYPDLFNEYSTLLSIHGMWKHTNPTGLTRDHKVSVNEAIRNGYDPFYIRHPLNCELMPWIENNKKNTSSSMTYVDLKQAVDVYERDRISAPVVGIEPTCTLLGP